MSDWLIAFKRLYPGIVLDVMFENRVEDLMRDEIDIAVRVMSEPPQNLVARDMGAVRYVACASPEFACTQGLPATLDDLWRRHFETTLDGKAFLVRRDSGHGMPQSESHIAHPFEAQG